MTTTNSGTVERRRRRRRQRQRRRRRRRRDRDTDTTWRLVKNCSFPIRKRVQHDDGRCQCRCRRRSCHARSSCVVVVSCVLCFCCRCTTVSCFFSPYFCTQTVWAKERRKQRDRERESEWESAQRRRSQACSTVVCANSALLINSCTGPNLA